MATIHAKRIPDDLWHRCRIEAARRGITLRRLLILALRDFLNRTGSNAGHEPH